jgi:hypothetical protein
MIRAFFRVLIFQCVPSGFGAHLAWNNEQKQTRKNARKRANAGVIGAICGHPPMAAD